MVLALFAFRVRPEAQTEFHEAVTRMTALVQGMPGFISMDLFTSEDGRSLSVARFASEEALLAWRDHPEHIIAQKMGKDAVFEDYWLDVCATLRSYEFHRPR